MAPAKALFPLISAFTLHLFVSISQWENLAKDNFGAQKSVPKSSLLCNVTCPGGWGREEVQLLQSPMRLIFVRETTAATKDLQILLLGNSHVFPQEKGSKP